MQTKKSQVLSENAKSPEDKLTSIQAVLDTVHRLRAPDGCPWDREQTHQSLRPYLIEEAYEVLDILDQIHETKALLKPETKNALIEELGDLLLQILLHSEMASEQDAFDFHDVAKTLNEKLIRRHPHVFSDQSVSSSDGAYKNWEKQKAKEKKDKGLQQGTLSGVPRALPSLQKAFRVIEKVSRVGFVCPIEKIDEEMEELRAEVKKLEQLKEKEHSLAETRLRVEQELGDVLFTLCNLAYHSKVDPEQALRNTVTRFEKRFLHVENRLHAQGKIVDPKENDLMEDFWKEAKKLEKVRIWGLTGGVASGKSLAAEFFRKKGIPVINADLIGRELLENDPETKEAVQKRFQTTDRAQLRKIIFQDSSARKELEQIMHPRILNQSTQEFMKLAEDHPILIYEAALLMETKRSDQFDGLILIDASRETRLKRVIARDGVSEDLAQQILSSQISDEERNRRKEIAHTIENNDSEENFQKRLEDFFKAQNWKPNRFTK